MGGLNGYPMFERGAGEASWRLSAGVLERKTSGGRRAGFQEVLRGIAVGMSAWVPAAAVLALCILIVPSAAGAWGAKPKTRAVTPSVTEGRAPEFALRGVQGERFRLSDWRGKQPVLIIFSTTWCTFCKTEIPRFRNIHETYANQGLVIVNVNLLEPREKVASFAAERQLPYPVLVDEDGTVGKLYGIRGVPALVLIDRNGAVACLQCRDVEPRIEALLKGK